jgi:hypothetical protein
MTRVLLAVLLCASFAAAQTFSFGAKAGLFTTGSDPGRSNSESKPYLLGPTVEFKVPIGFSIEGSALYSRLGESVFTPATGQLGIGPIFSRTRANSWEFPIMAKRYLPEYRHGIQPFISGGYVVRHIDIDNYQLSVFGADRLQLLAAPTADNPTHGIGASAGLQIPLGRFKISPELRYTRWVNSPNSGVSVVDQRNKVGVLVGFTF